MARRAAAWARLIVDFRPEVTRVFRRELTRLEVMFRGSGLGQDIIVLPLFPCRYGWTGFEAEAVVSGLQNVAAVGEAVEECGRHLGIAEDRCPFAEAQVRVDDDARAFVELAQQMEEQCAAATIAGIETARMIRIGQFGVSGITAFQQFAEFAA